MTISESENLTLTPAAAERIARQLEKRGHGLGLRVGVRRSGCSGYRYTMDFADKIDAEDAVFEEHGAKLIVAHKFLPMLSGTTVDFRAEGLNRIFQFDNPRAKNACGCGESFMV